MKPDTIRLVYPQWQGGDIARWFDEFDDKTLVSRGYALGARLLDALAPNSGQETLTVPVDLAPGPRTVTEGVLDRAPILRQTQAALAYPPLVMGQKRLRYSQLRGRRLLRQALFLAQEREYPPEIRPVHPFHLFAATAKNNMPDIFRQTARPFQTLRGKIIQAVLYITFFTK